MMVTEQPGYIVKYTP